MKINTLTFLLIMTTCMPVYLTSQELPEFTGKAGSVKQQKDHIAIVAGQIMVNLYVYSPATVRIRYAKEAFATDFSYAVVQKPMETGFTLKDHPDSAVVTTDSLRIIIGKNPLRFTFLNRNGEILSSDQPGLPVSWLGHEVTCYRKLFADEKFLGLGEKTGNLNKRGASYQMWNSDVPAYATNHDPLYQSIPFFIGIHDKVTYGIFLDNPRRTRFNFGASTDEQFSSFSAEGGELNYYFFGASTVAGIIRDYTFLTGRMTMPPYWSIGYQQCRWSYFPESQVMSVAQTFRDKQIPCDVIYLDIDYMDGYKIFTWNREKFPDPKGMISRLNTMGFHVVTIVDPGIRVEKGYFAYDEGVANNYFATYPDGSNYVGSVWPGRCHFPDFTMEAVRSWWGASFTHLTEPGVEGFWNDMNEPSAWGQSIPDIVQFGFEGRKGSMTEAHNIYGLEMSRATFEGTRKLLNGKRTFGLTRAGYAGIQRYSAVWTGDNEATDDHMLLSARMVTGLGLSGVSFTGPDVGGFMGNPSEQLYTRWMSLGVFTPFFRNHSAWDTKSKEPWAFGLNVERQVKAMIELRYRLLPYIYPAFYESSQSGLPVARSLAIDFTHDEKVYWYVYQNQYMFGDNLLVCPVSCQQQASRVYLPDGGWYRFSSGEYYDGATEVTVDAPLHDLPVFVRASGIIPMQSVIRHTSEKPSPALELHVYAGTKPNTFHYYEDDGSTYAYEKGIWYKRDIRFDPVNRTIQLTAVNGSHTTRYTAIRFVLHGFDDTMTLRTAEGEVSLKLRSATEKTAEMPFGAGELVVGY